MVSTVRHVLASGYYLGRLLLTGIRGLIYLRWRIWRAGKTFRSELRRNGLPENVAHILSTQYNLQSKQIFGSLTNFASFGQKRAKKDR